MLSSIAPLDIDQTARFGCDPATQSVFEASPDAVHRTTTSRTTRNGLLIRKVVAHASFVVLVAACRPVSSALVVVVATPVPVSC